MFTTLNSVWDTQGVKCQEQLVLWEKVAQKKKGYRKERMM